MTESPGRLRRPGLSMVTPKEGSTFYGAVVDSVNVRVLL